MQKKFEKIEELNSDAQELADLAKIKEIVIGDLKKSLFEAKNRIVAMQEEIRSLQATNAAAVDEDPVDQTANHVSAHNLESIQERYSRVLAILREEHCSMANAFRLVRCPRSTIREFVAIAELKIANASRDDILLSNKKPTLQK